MMLLLSCWSLPTTAQQWKERTNSAEISQQNTKLLIYAKITCYEIDLCAIDLTKICLSQR